MKRVLAILLVVFLLAGCLGETVTKPDDGNGTDGPILEGPPKTGDVVKINYIMKTEGVVFDTTYEDVAMASPNSETIVPLHTFGFEPLSFIVGSGHMNPELSNAVESMKVGEKKTIIIPPEKSLFGTRREELVQVMPRFSRVPREETIPTPLFQSSFGIEPEVGIELPYQYWNSTIVEVNNESTIIRHNPVSGSNIEGLGGNVTVVFDETTVTMEFVPRINYTFRTPDGSYVTVVSANETHMVVDYNNPMAGKSIETEIVLEEISTPIQWQSNLKESLSLSAETGKPVFVLFTNVTCVTCRRIELETLTHPFMLALKDELVWTKIDNEIQKEVAEKYGAEELPLILILKNGEEIRRITDFLPPQALRAELESVLAPNQS
jgi:FKBP-type peptidyl-prolyl cis-trans isomerase 2